MRRPLIAGNWKMHTTLREAVALGNGLKRALSGVEGVDVAVCPPYVWLADVRDALEGSGIALGAQDLHWEPRGAFTGEISAAMLREIGCSIVIVGHSERRHGLGETDAMVRKKLHAALEAGLTPIVCVGELLEERERNATQAVVRAQVEAALAGLSPSAVERIVIAYEPVWAIGTGRTATAEQAQEVHSFIRRLVERLAGAAAAGVVRIQYGGSVRESNIRELMACPDVDGALVGGASLDAAQFASIVRYR